MAGLYEEGGGVKIPRSGPVWFLVCGIPLLVVCLVGLAAGLAGFDWLDRKCVEWQEALWR